MFLMTKINVTVIVPVKNEELNLPKCLDRLTGFNQVIVMDSNSTDRTYDITQEYGVEYTNFEWNGQFPKKRNWALRNLDIRHEWVLFLDADEYLTNAFVQELQEKILDTSKNGYWVVFKNYFMGKQLNYGDPFPKLPLIRKGKGEYEKIEEDLWTNLDMEVHEHPIIEGETGTFRQPIIHNDYKGLEQYITRHNAYSTWEANRFLLLKRNGFKNLTQRQKIKYKLMQVGLLPLFFFIGSYILKLGFLDGKEGYYLARYKANYFFQIQTKIVELSRQQNNTN
jgi:glycosyltransferase involved in cell wall biosynthesis